MRKLLLLCCSLLLVLPLVSADNADKPTATLKAIGSTIDDRFIAKPGATFWVEVCLPKMDKAKSVAFSLRYDEKILKLERVSDRKNGSGAVKGLDRKDNHVVMDPSQLKSESIFVEFKAKEKGKTEIRPELGTILLDSGQSVAITFGNNLPVITNIEDSSWSRLKAIFNK